MHVFRGVTTAWTGVDMSTSLSPEIVPKIYANREHKRLNLYTRVSSSSAMLEQRGDRKCGSGKCDTVKKQGWKMQEWKMRDQIAGVEMQE